MTPNIMRQLWSLVESSDSGTLLDLDDRNLVQWLMKQMEIRSQSSAQAIPDPQSLERYIADHVLLIRDIADGPLPRQTSRHAVAPMAAC